MTTQLERLARVEVEVMTLRAEVDELRAEIKTMNGKLDTLLELRWKGAGAFWLASALFGTGIVAAVFSFFGLPHGK